MKKINKFCSFILSMTIICGLFPNSTVIAANEVKNEYDFESYSNEEVKPKIDINYLGTTPTNPMEGQDFMVRYQIVPHPFQHNLSKSKELVMVLDKSGSMDYCSSHGELEGHKIYTYQNSSYICYDDDFGRLGFSKCKNHNKYKSSHIQNSCNEPSKIKALKSAAVNFIDKLTEVDNRTNTPKITNLSIGVVAYDANGNIVEELINVTNDTEVITKNVNALKVAINNISASGGTNTGDGLRKGAYLLNESKTDATKAIVFMGDGEPTYYSNKTNNDIKNYYTNLDEKVVSNSTSPYRRGSGSSDDNGYSLEYAKTIGSIIKDKQYNVFSIGYGLGSEDSEANKKMKQIHESMGGISSGEKSTFFATDAGAIDSVFSKIADTLEKSYSFSDAQLNLNLSENLQIVDGFSTSDENGNLIKIKPIVYELGEGNWYTAETQTIEFIIRANTSGEFNMFQGENHLTYTDIYGNTKKVPIENSTILINPFEATEAQKLSVDLKGDAPGYLIGDTIMTTVTMTHPHIDGITYSEAKFNLNTIPNNLKMLNGINPELSFGNVSETTTKEYKFIIEDDSEITINKEKLYTLYGDYSYKLNQNNVTTAISGDKSLGINVKRGQINVKVLDEEGNDITELSDIVVKDKKDNEILGNFNNGNIVFDNISSGNHELVIKGLPDGCYPTENGGNANVVLNYTNNVVNYTFNVSGTVVSSDIEIDANLIGHSPSYPYLDDNITITYEITPKEFRKKGIENIIIENAKLVFDLGGKFTPVEGEGLVPDQSGRYILDISDKVKYNYDSTSNKYVANKFTVSFKVISNTVGDNVSFNGGKIEYSNVVEESKPIISSEIDVPSMTIRSIEPIPEYDGPDIRILEIEPADKFKLAFMNDTTGIEEYVVKQLNGKDYKVEIVHITMQEFIGKVEQLNGRYDVIVIGNHLEIGINDKYEFSSYKKSDGYERYNNDITDKKAKEIKEFIESGQLVFIDESIKEIKDTNLYKHISDINGYWYKDYDNLIKNMSVNESESQQIEIRYIVQKYLELIDKNNNMKKAHVTSSFPEGDTNDDSLGSVYKRNMRFNIKVSDVLNEDITINLYLDINGDGLFKEEEVVKSIENVRVSEEGYRLEYDFYKDYPHFIGYLDWRVEIVKSPLATYTEPIKSYFDGSILFRRVVEEKREINVLQVSPYSEVNINNGNNKKTNLLQNEKFMSLLSDLKDYDIKVEVISSDDFYQGDFQGPGKVSLRDSKYDIIIVGFGDEYKDSTSGGLKQLSSQAIKEIKEFIRVGQGLMLTHDTIYKDNYEIVGTFRDIIGQSRYKDENNPSELDIDGSRIIPHDTDVQNNNSIGGSIWRVYGGDNSNSTKVYKVNESLITKYPYDLGDEIRVRRTHGQYFQLNLEDDNVVTNFTLTNYNKSLDANGNEVEANQLWKRSAKADKYDVRNNYYTYSKGNITFSGTGEDGREDDYPEDELKLFVNTIVKAERGANHKPEISALENINEVPYNANLDFNAIVKDIDGDKIRINKITVDGKSVNGYKTPTSFLNQGSKFPVTITPDYFTNKTGQDVKVIIEAEDLKGAITIKEYVIRPVVDALLTSKGEIIDSLVGEKISFDIKLNRENDTSPSSISIKDIQVPNKEGIVNLSNIKTKVINGEIYLSGNIIPLVESTGEEISIILNYTNGTSTSKRCEVKIILNSRYANVNVVLKGDTGNVGISPKIELLNKTNNKSYTSNISSVDGQVGFNTIDAGEYEMSLTELVGYDIEAISINGIKVNSSSDGKINFNINFNESSKLIEIIVRSKISDLYHGLYGGIEEVSENNSIVKILENPNGFEMMAGNKVTFGAKFTVRANSFKFNLSVDNKLENVLLSNIKVYKTINDGEDIALEELTNINGNTIRTTEESGKSFEISISNIGSTGYSVEKEIIVIYTGKINSNSKNDRFKNIIKFTDNNTKDAIIYTTNNGQDQVKELPDLF